MSLSDIRARPDLSEQLGHTGITVICFYLTHFQDCHLACQLPRSSRQHRQLNSPAHASLQVAFLQPECNLETEDFDQNQPGWDRNLSCSSPTLHREACDVPNSTKACWKFYGKTPFWVFPQCSDKKRWSFTCGIQLCTLKLAFSRTPTSWILAESPECILEVIFRVLQTTLCTLSSSHVMFTCSRDFFFTRL